MRAFLMMGPLALLAACGAGNESATFFCTNGPELAVVYSDDSATLFLNDGRTFTLPEVGPGLYAQPGIVWQAVAFRTGRLTDGQRSLNCDQSSL